MNSRVIGKNNFTKTILLLAIVLVIFTSGCTAIEMYSDENLNSEEVTIERIRIYRVANYTGFLEMSGTADKYQMFIPYSDQYQEIKMPANLHTERDEYGNLLTTAEGEYNMTFEFKAGSTKNDFTDYQYPFETSSDHRLYLKSTELIDIENPLIKETVSNLLNNVTSSFEAIEILNNWTNNYLTYSIFEERDRNTEQILVKKIGSCEEYTRLYTALARNAGIPTRIVAGWVDQNGLIDPHMWAESYVPGNGWIHVEPSNGEFKTIGVAHLKQYVGPDKLAETYYGNLPQRTFKIQFDITEYNCMIKNGQEECTETTEKQVSGIL